MMGKIETQYVYEKIWHETKEEELLKIIREELGDTDPQGVLSYVKDTLKKSKMMSVGDCRFRYKI